MRLSNSTATIDWVTRRIHHIHFLQLYSLCRSENDIYVRVSSLSWVVHRRQSSINHRTCVVVKNRRVEKKNFHVSCTSGKNIHFHLLVHCLVHVPPLSLSRRTSFRINYYLLLPCITETFSFHQIHNSGIVIIIP